MRLFGAIAFFALLFVCSHGRASATVCTQPNSLVNGGYVDANALNTNFQALVTCGNAIDNTNIGTAGIYASQILPTTVGQAVFGGTQAYTFMNGLNVVGTENVTGSLYATIGVAAPSVQSQTTLNSNYAAVPPVYTHTGTARTSAHIIADNSSCTATGPTCLQQIQFSTNEAFGSSAAFACSVNYYGSNTAGAINVINVDARDVQFVITSGATSGTTYSFAYACTGFN